VYVEVATVDDVSVIALTDLCEEILLGSIPEELVVEHKEARSGT
jgi:hypothetical protein